MKIIQTFTVVGANVVVTLTEHPSGQVLSARVWQGAAQYVRFSPVHGYVNIMVPEQSGIDIQEGK